MIKLMQRVFILLTRVFVFCAAFFPVLFIDIWRGLKTGLRLGRLDFENDLIDKKEAVQMEMFRMSSYKPITPEEVLKNGH